MGSNKRVFNSLPFQDSMDRRLEIAYILWGIIWWLMGIYDIMFRDFSILYNQAHETHVTIAVFTVAIFSLACLYYLSQVKIVGTKGKVLYFLMYLVAPSLWNISYLTYKHLASGWMPTVPQKIAPYIYLPVWVWWLVSIGGTMIWVVFWALTKLNVIKIEVE